MSHLLVFQITLVPSTVLTWKHFPTLETVLLLKNLDLLRPFLPKPIILEAVSQSTEAWMSIIFVSGNLSSTSSNDLSLSFFLVLSAFILHDRWSFGAVASTVWYQCILIHHKPSRFHLTKKGKLLFWLLSVCHSRRCMTSWCVDGWTNDWHLPTMPFLTQFTQWVHTLFCQV